MSDYARLNALHKEGGIYLDTDMYIVRDFDFLGYDLILGKEDSDYISAGMIASSKENIYIKDLLDIYDNLQERETIPRLMTRVFNRNKNKYTSENIKIKIFDHIYFYPFSAENINKFNYNNTPKESYGVHLWDYSWGNPTNRLIKKIGIHKYLKTFTEKLGIKKMIKKVLRME